MLVDLVQIQRLGEKKRPENEALRRYMRTHDVPERRLRHVAEEIQAQIDCTACANCCRVATTTLLQRDVERLARHFRLTIGRFKAAYTTLDPGEGLILARTASGCVFLEGNSCSVYDVRPATCSDFPHLVRGAGSLTSRMWQFIDRATYCPIVYNALEAFKPILGFRPK